MIAHRKKLPAQCLAILFPMLTACTNLLQVDTAEPDYHDPIRFGLLLPVSLERSRQETLYLTTVLAAEEINNAGGVLGRDIEIVFRDDGGSPAQGVREAQQFRNEGVDIIIGPSWSSVTLAIAQEITVPNGMLLVSHSATNSRITSLVDNDLVWRTANSDIFQARIGADYAYQTLGKRTAGVIYSSNVWAQGLAESFRTNFERLAGPGSVVSFVTYPEGQDWTSYNFMPELDVLYAAKPEFVYIVSFISDAVKLTQDTFVGNYFNAGYRPQLFSVDGVFHQDFAFNSQPEILQGMMGTRPTGNVTDPSHERFMLNYFDRFGETLPGSYAEHIYDAVYLIAYAMLKSGSTAPAGVAAQLRSVSGGTPGVTGTRISVNEYAKAKALIESGEDIDYDGASGKIAFDENGDPGSGTYIIWKVVDGEFTVEATVTFP